METRYITKQDLQEFKQLILERIKSYEEGDNQELEEKLKLKEDELKAKELRIKILSKSKDIPENIQSIMKTITKTEKSHEDYPIVKDGHIYKKYIN